MDWVGVVGNEDPGAVGLSEFKEQVCAREEPENIGGKESESENAMFAVKILGVEPFLVMTKFRMFSLAVRGSLS